MHRCFPKEQRLIAYTDMVLEGMLFEHLTEIDRSCNSRMKIFCKVMAEREDATKALKATNQMKEMARRMNISHDRAKESVLCELVCDM